jgi:hypothetical protein
MMAVSLLCTLFGVPAVSVLRLFMLSLLCLAVGIASATAAEKKVRLFVLSGQSNMVGLDPKASFTPAVKEEFAGDEVIVVKFAKSGQPIRRWYKKWKLPDGATDRRAGRKNGDLYDQLLEKVREALGDKKPDSVAFVWMQGERDAKAGWQAAYYESLRGVVEQLRSDLKHPDIAVVVGRLSDHLSGNAGWDAVRAAQEKVAAAEPLGAWVDTDDLNGKDGLHYNKQGYAELGRRFAKGAIELIRRHEAK